MGMCEEEGLPRNFTSPFNARQGQGPWPGILYTKRLFTQEGDYKNFVLLLLSRQLRYSALNYSPSRGHFEEVTWCLSELALTFSSSAGSPSTGFSAGSGATGVH